VLREDVPLAGDQARISQQPQLVRTGRRLHADGLGKLGDGARPFPQPGKDQYPGDGVARACQVAAIRPAPTVSTRACGEQAAEAGFTEVHKGLLPQGKVAAVRERPQGPGTRRRGQRCSCAGCRAHRHRHGQAGSDLALETVDAVIVRDELAAVPIVIALSRRARRLH
jgi:hypothetical protein